MDGGNILSAKCMKMSKYYFNGSCSFSLYSSFLILWMENLHGPTTPNNETTV